MRAGPAINDRCNVGLIEPNSLIFDDCNAGQRAGSERVIQRDRFAPCFKKMRNAAASAKSVETSVKWQRRQMPPKPIEQFELAPLKPRRGHWRRVAVDRGNVHTSGCHGNHATPLIYHMSPVTCHQVTLSPPHPLTPSPPHFPRHCLPRPFCARCRKSMTMLPDKIKVHAVTVYCSSSQGVAPVYFEAAAELGMRIAKEHWLLIYGGNNIGCMGSMANAARAAEGKVIGITPRLLVEHGIADKLCDELVVTENIRERKAMMEARGQAFVTLPGGLGTLEEIFEIIVGKTLGYHNKPIVILNVADFFDPLLNMFDHGINQNFIKPWARELFHVSSTVDDAIQFLKNELASAE